MQMVLGTKGAAWSLQVEHEKDGRGRDQVGSIAFKHQGAASGRVKMRTRLNGFAMPGSQAKSTHVDDDEVGGFSDPEFNDQDATMNVEEVEKSHELILERSSERIDLPVPARRDELSQPIDNIQGHYNLVSIPPTKDSIIDLTDNLTDNDKGSTIVQQNSPEGSVEKLSYREVIRTDREYSALRFDLDRLSSMWSRLRSPSKPFSTSPLSDLQTLHASANVRNADDAEGAERMDSQGRLLIYACPWTVQSRLHHYTSGQTV